MSAEKVLVLGSDNRSFLAVVRSLGRRGLQVHAGWCPPHAAARHSRYIHKVHDPPPYSPQSTDWKRALVALMHAEQFALVIAADDPTLIPLQTHKVELTQHGRVYVLDDAAFEVAFDKVKSYQLAQAQGVAVPRGMAVSGPAEFETACSTFTPPVIIKPRTTFERRDLVNRHSVRRANSQDELRTALRVMTAQGEVLVQEYVDGAGVGVEVLADRGEVLCAFQHLRIHEPPTGGGSSYRKSVPLTPALAAATRRLVASLRYTGVAMVEFRVDPQTGRWVFIEINGRFWGSLPLAVAAGADFPWYLYELLVHGKRDFPSHYRVDLYCRNLWLDAVWLSANARARRADPAAPTRSAWEVAGEVRNLVTLRERSDTLVVDDPRPGIVELRQLIGVVGNRVLGRCWMTFLALPPVRRLFREKARRALAGAKALLFVCKGNICRSPFAEYYAGATFPASVQVASCGYYPREGRACPETAVDAAKTLGVELASHRSRSLSEEMVRDAQAIFTFDEEDYMTVTARYPHARSKVHPLGLLTVPPGLAIRDPYGGSRDVFAAVYQTIARALDSRGQRSVS